MKIYTCRHCKVKFVVIPTFRGLLIPVESENGEGFDEFAIYDGSVHISHLARCKERHGDWHETLKSLGLPLRIKLKGTK